MRENVSRRRALQLLSGTAAVGLAGCGSQADGGDGGSNGDGGGGDGGDGGGGGASHGERVPTVAIEFWSDRGGQTEVFTQWAEIYQDNLSALGVDVEMIAANSNTMVSNLTQDQRVVHAAQWSNDASADPDRYIRFFTSTTGMGRLPGWVNWAQWINCEFETAYRNQLRAASAEERRQYVNEAVSIMSQDKTHITQMPQVYYGAYRKDLIELNGTGNYGMTFWARLRSEHRDGGTIVANTVPEYISAVDPEAPTGGGSWFYGPIAHSPLVFFDENDELQNVLAESYEVSEGGQRLTFTLRDDVTFHDGEPITSEDVEFTLNIHQDNPDWSGLLMNYDVLESFESIDDRQFAFNWTEPNLLALTIPLTAMEILPMHVWEGATDDPLGFEPDPPIGSGPYRIENFESENFMHLVPHEGHPIEPRSDLLLQGYQDQTSAMQAFRQGEINWLAGLNYGGYSNLEESMSPDRLGLDATPTTGVLYYLTQCHVAPVTFVEFRDAMGTVMDRQLMNEVTHGGLNEPELYSTTLMANDPWRPPDDTLHQFTDDPSGDVEAARQKLADAGWTWDDDGNLRYPADADPSPQWPQGEYPADGQFSCITATENGYAVER